ncbi:MAG TPA: cytochrome P450 [Streptosporangiaceae bacterium]|nr:cytochrome P450 [Streptosporangiaceae bacterium]
MTRYPVGAAATLAELETDPHPLLARLRAREPVSWLPALGGWLVTRHDLAVGVMRDATTFTVDDPRFSTAQVIGPSMLSTDGGTHTRHREPFARSFRPADVRTRFAAFVAAEVDRLIAGVRPAGAAEVRGAIAGPLSVAVVADALGLAGADATVIRSWYHAFVEAISDITAGRTAQRAAADAFGMLRASVQDTLRHGHPSSLLVAAAAQADGSGLSVAEVVSNAAVLMFGGIDTTEGMITNAIAHLLGHPGQLKLVLAEPDLLPNAIEESARMEPAAAVIDRYATAHVTLAGAAISRGDLVRVSISAANRDPAVFGDPDRFDVRRKNTRLHLAFAHGPHFCFGAHLARLEAQTAIGGMLGQLPGLRLDPEHSAAPRGLVFRKPTELHVRWD